MSVPSTYIFDRFFACERSILSFLKLLSIFFFLSLFLSLHLSRHFSSVSLSPSSISPSLFRLTFSLPLPFINFYLYISLLFISLSFPFLLCSNLNLSDLTYVSISSLKVVSSKNQGGLKVRLLGDWSRTLVLGIIF